MGKTIKKKKKNVSFKTFPLLYLFLSFRMTLLRNSHNKAKIIASARWIILSYCIYSHP